MVVRAPLIRPGPLLVGLVALVPLLLSGCSASSSSTGATPAGSTGPSESTSAITSSSPTFASVETRALATYRAMWADMVTAGRTADYESPLLAKHAASQALQLLVSGLYEAHKKNVVIKGEPALNPRVTALTPADNPAAATIADCFDDSHWLNYKPNGQLQDDVPGGKHNTTATVGNLDGTWKVTRLQVQGVGTC